MRNGFANRDEAGRALASALVGKVPSDALVLGLPRGGVPVAAAIARSLALELGVLLVRKVGVPWQPELAMGAVTEEGLFLDDQIIAQARIPVDVVERVVAEERAELERRRLRLGMTSRPRVMGRHVVLVDDGLATGSSMIAAVRAVKTSAASSVMVAVPVGSPTGVQAVAAEGVEVVCPLKPRSFMAVGQWYEDFSEVSDDDVRSLLDDEQD